MAGRIKIDFERCKGCGLCVAVCPKTSIAISTQSNKGGYFPAQASSNNCTGCAACAIVCPDAAIVVYRDDSDTDEQRDKSAKARRHIGAKTAKR
jgi:2-oxoglutarate ferredoxin oxidoreductase subunit delta